jgi:hypothetical protein
MTKFNTHTSHSTFNSKPALHHLSVKLDDLHERLLTKRTHKDVRAVLQLDVRHQTTGLLQLKFAKERLMKGRPGYGETPEKICHLMTNWINQLEQVARQLGL